MADEGKRMIPDVMALARDVDRLFRAAIKARDNEIEAERAVAAATQEPIP